MTILLDQPVVCPVLIGRSAEMAVLQERLEAAKRGQGGVVLLSGKLALANRGCWPNCNGRHPIMDSSCSVASVSQPIAPAPMPPCLISCVRSWPHSRLYRSRRCWDPPLVGSFPYFLSRSNTCLN